MKSRIIKSFNQAAESYDDAAVMQKEVAHRLIDHLDEIQRNPKFILDLGAGTGYATKLLEKRYPNATIIAIDIAEKMLKKSQLPGCVCADIEKLPLFPQQFDLVFSSLTLQWCTALPQIFKEVNEVLHPEGLFLFSTLGPDTLKEFRTSWAVVDNSEHVNSFVDMHNIGDILLHSGFSDPVMEMEYLTINYPDLYVLIRDLKRTGSHNVAANKGVGLQGKTQFQKFVTAYEQYRLPDHTLPATYEIIYGHAWKRNLISSEVTISIDEIQWREK